MHKSILFVLILNISFLSFASAQPWHRDNRAMGVAALSVAATSAVTAGVSWWAYKKYSSDIEPVNTKSSEAAQKAEPIAREIATLNEQLMQSHVRDFHMASNRSLYFLPQMKARAALLTGVNLQQALAPVETHDAKPCPCENADRWNFSNGKSVRTKGACPAIQEGYEAVQKELKKHADSQQAAVTKEQQTLESNKSLENKKWWAKTIGITSSIVSLASLGVYGWSYFKAQKTSK